jgi:hypothetical protein
VIVEEGVHIPAGFRAGFDLDGDRAHHTVTESGIVVINHDTARQKPAILKFAVNGASRLSVSTRGDAVAFRARA